jgi:small subunit ribosomal protein S8e
MDQYHEGIGKKVLGGTGGRRKKFADKTLAHVGGKFTSTKVSETEAKSEKRKRGGSKGIKLKKAAFVNIALKESDKQIIKKERIIRVIESHNPEFIRQNIITKGAIVETKIGKVKVTNRVGQDGIVNGVLMV